MNIYMDNCCFNRVFDDRSYPNIYFDRNSVMLILELIENGEFNLYGSQMLAKEIKDTIDVIRREGLELLYSLCSSEIEVTEEIAKRAVEIRNQSNIRMKDSIHIACAESVSVDVFLTVDKRFKNNGRNFGNFIASFT